jgi:2,3-bisphosphoglycerate-dependent phosphoglycerate mutase
VILLARHGETDDNVAPQRFMGSRDTPLNARGREQARALAEAMAGAGLAAVWSSGLRRALETAEIVGAAVALEPRVDDRLAESHRGRWEGRVVTDIAREEPDLWAAWRRGGAGFRFPGGESLAEHQRRALAALDAVRTGPLPALVVAHGGTIRAIAAAAHPRGLDAFHDLEVPNGAVFSLDDLGRWTRAA